LRRPVAWWRNFRAVPEEFPEVRMNGLSTEGLLLWDGDCNFCSKMVGRMKGLVRRPFAESPYQLVKNQLPEPVLRWSNRQAHWIDAQGRVTGGSAAFLEMLEQSGRPFWAAFLSSDPLRPFVWFAYRFVAANRGWLANFFIRID
jgi:predicted DCC family thiol-disulfide oxidoreductase YuxK